MPQGGSEQYDRMLRIWTPLGGDWLRIRSLRGREAISELFWFDFELVSEKFDLKPADLIAKSVTAGIMFYDEFRYFNGVVSEFSMLSATERHARYAVRVVPVLWFLTRTSDCAIYQDLNVPDIIDKVLRNCGVTDFSNRLTKTYEPREYCVQYRETAFDFISRLMQEEGIAYWFEHGQKTHTFVMADDVSAHSDLPGDATVRWEPSAGTGFVRDEGYITEWMRRVEVKPKQWTQADYNFEQPSLNLSSTVPTATRFSFPAYEKYDYPGKFATTAAGDTSTKLRMEEDEADIEVITGQSRRQEFAPGLKFTFAEHYRTDQNGDYVLTSVEHEIDQTNIFSSNEAKEGEEDRYTNRFTCIPRAVPFRPARTTPRPVVYGPQTAFVTGVSGEEIYTDNYGRVKVQFHWDRKGVYDENSSCWLRVSQSIAGKKWGSVMLPRVGQEVIVSFLEGDPDRPIITGSVYNADQMPPYTLPDEKSKSTFKSYSYKGGGGFNEIRFEDKKDSEQVFIHAQKNYDERIKNDSYSTVLNDSHFTVTRDHLTKISRDQHLNVVGDQNIKVGGAISVKSATDWQQKAGVNYALDAGTEVHIKAGTNMVLECGASLTLKVGGNFININSGGVFVKGSLIMLNSGGAAGSGAGANPEVPKDPTEAATADPGQSVTQPPAKTPPTPVTWSSQAIVMQQAHRDAAPFCEICEQMRQEREQSGAAQ